MVAWVPVKGQMFSGKNLQGHQLSAAIVPSQWSRAKASALAGCCWMVKWWFGSLGENHAFRVYWAALDKSGSRAQALNCFACFAVFALLQVIGCTQLITFLVQADGAGGLVA